MPDGAITLGQVAAALELDTSQFTEATLGATGTVAELIQMLKQLGVVTEDLKAKMTVAANTELIEYRSLLEAERIRDEALRKTYADQLDYAALTARLHAIEQAQIRENTIATTVGFEQELAYRTNRDKVRSASEKDYANLVKQLKAEEIAAIEEQTAARIATENLIEVEVNERIAQTVASERFERKVMADLRAKDLAEEVAANRIKAESQAQLAGGAALGGRIVGGWAGAAAARGAFSIGAPILGGLALAGLTYEMVKWTNESEKAAQSTKNFAEELGITWDQARHLEELAKLAGTSVSTLSQASGRLAVSLDAGSSSGKDITKALNDIGVSGASSGELLLNFLERLSEIPDQAKRIDEARRVLGRGAAEIVPLISNLDQLNSQLGQLGGNLNSGLAASLVGAEEHTRLLEVAWTRLKQNLAVTAYPTITFIVDVVTKAITPGTSTGTLADNHTSSLLSNFKQEPFADQYRALTGEKSETQKLVDLANERLAVHRKTLDGMKEELATVKSTVAEQEKILYRTDKPATKPEAAAAQASLDAATRRREQLEASIKDLEGKTAAAQARAQGKSYEIQAAELDAVLRKKQTDLELSRPLRDRKEDTSSPENIQARLEEEKAFNQKYLDNILDTIQKKNAIQKGSGHVTDETLDQQASSAQEKNLLNSHKAEQEAYDARSELIRKFGEEAKKVGESSLKDLEKQLKEMVDAQIKADDEALKDKLKADEIYLNSKIQHQKNLENLERNAVEFQFKQGNISLAQKTANLKALADAADSAELEDLDKKRALYAANTNIDNHVLAQIADVDRRKKEIQDQAKLRSQKDNEVLATGDSTDVAIAGERSQQQSLNSTDDLSSRTVQLTNLHIQTLALSSATKGLGGIYADLAGVVENAFGGIGKDLANLTFAHKNFGKELRKEAQSILKDIEGSLVQGVINLGVGKIITTVTHGGGQAGQATAQAAQAKLSQVSEQQNTTATIDNTAAMYPLTTAEINNTTAVTANTAAIYQLIVALHLAAAGSAASGVGAVVGAIIGATAKVAIGASEGGDVHDSGLARVHLGETILNPRTSKGLKDMVASGSFGQSSGGDVHLHNPRFVGHFTKAEIDSIGNGLVKAGRRTGASV